MTAEEQQKEGLKPPEKTANVAAECLRMNGILIQGYAQLLAILYQDGPVQKQYLMEIIRDTMAKAR